MGRRRIHVENLAIVKQGRPLSNCAPLSLYLQGKPQSGAKLHFAATFRPYWAVFKLCKYFPAKCLPRCRASVMLDIMPNATEVGHLTFTSIIS